MSSIYGTPRMPDHPPPQFTLDQQIALGGATARLARDLDGVYGAETIERFLVSSYAELADRATVVNFLPFLCTHNAGRSQMALAFFSHHTGDAAVAWSGGSEPTTSINPAVVAAMAERGIDVSGEYPKPWTSEVLRAADVVISMGCGDCPVFPGTRHEEWNVDDPAGLALPDVRRIRDDIERRVLALVDQLHPGRGIA